MIGPELQAKIDKMNSLIDAGIIDNEVSGNGIQDLSCFDYPNANELLEKTKLPKPLVHLHFMPKYILSAFPNI